MRSSMDDDNDVTVSADAESVETVLPLSECSLQASQTSSVVVSAAAASEPKDVEALAKAEENAKKLIDLRRKAVNSASLWNTNFNKSRQQQRRAYFDISTMTLQCPTKRAKIADPAKNNVASNPYPVAVMPSQYQNFYRKFSSDELRKLPFNTVAETEDYLPKLSITDFQLDEPETFSEASQAIIYKSSRVSVESPGLIDVAKIDRGEDTGEICAFCRRDLFTNDRFVQCAKCGSCGHPSCMEMTPDMFHIIKCYPWECMECKPCSVCSKLDEEEHMLFCDSCDRGYHTFCVNLKELPTGQWLCPLYCQGKIAERNATAAGARVPQRGESVDVGNDDFCQKCGAELTKDNRPPLRSKYKKSGLCVSCIKYNRRGSHKEKQKIKEEIC